MGYISDTNTYTFLYYYHYYFFFKVNIFSTKKLSSIISMVSPLLRKSNNKPLIAPIRKNLLPKTIREFDDRSNISERDSRKVIYRYNKKLKTKKSKQYIYLLNLKHSSLC